MNHAHPFHKSSFRPPLLMGCERKPVLLLVLTCIGINLISFNLVAFVVSLVLWFCIYPLLLWMGQTDPDLVGIYFRNLQYPRHIPAFTSPFRKIPGYRVAKEHKVWNR